ncbi:hypothetical protein H4Q32_029698 [Labeo rohita]|uniref:DDE Tnp4 domain-containing protein n=1 Tax=Labeo rohita TaxID=84645 RepID=A0ABQ8L589_LABRO|nr:hypothetical protein H4Q32_029698 [Labeo rohita]
MKNILIFPKTPEEIQQASRQFHSIASIPRVIGIIDGTLISVASPVVAEEGGFGDSWLLGDSVYPLRPYLITPVQHPATIAEERFNQAHGRTCSTVERAIELWKQRFRCISKSSVKENVPFFDEKEGGLSGAAEDEDEDDDTSDEDDDDNDDPLNTHQGRMHTAGAEVRQL